MSDEITDPLLRIWNSKYESLVGLPLFRINNQFNTYYSFGKNENPICNSSIPEKSLLFSNLRNVCHKIDQILKNLLKIHLKYDIDINKRCEFLSYFIYDKIKNINTINNFQDIYKALNDAKKSYNLNDDECTILKFNIEEEFNKKKELFFCTDILYWIEKEYNNLFIGDSRFFNQYISECADFYNGIMQNDFCKNDKLYEPELKKFHEVFNQTKDFLKGKSVTSVENIKLKEKPACEPEAVDSVLQGKGLLVPETDRQMADISDQPIDVPVPKNSSNFGMHTSEGIILGITFGTFLLFLSVYKFTPFGTWLYNKIRKKKYIYSLEDKNNELLLDGSDNEDTNLYSELYPITYQSA
ncbi:PIR Superfamily Protein [Plasmodium ovale wallikeri]|uniref:PIR Superfamily Protein n=1 Tax=Plasmodium ovale wallikeri TaxID=864142 RepID=A0A1A9AP45_PLAOA|nr:PIR Superfamily Protein [Plasmodium ovale wallikeri]SBT57967.1 PIR Superfamily Protein [Plasmodium ovale wallikeri]